MLFPPLAVKLDQINRVLGLPILSEERGTVLFWVCLSNLSEGLYIHTEPVPTQYLLTRKPQLDQELNFFWEWVHLSRLIRLADKIQDAQSNLNFR